MVIDNSSGLGGLPSLFLFNAAVKNQKAPLANTAKDSHVKADIAYFTSTIAKLKTVDDFLKNTKLINFVLTAFGLQSQNNAMGIIKEVLSQDPTSKSALANKLADPRWQKMANALDFFHRGLAGLQAYSSTTTQKIQPGNITLTLNTTPNFKVGQMVTFADSAHPKQNFMVGAVSKINGKSVTISVSAGFGAIGSGTFSKWSVFANNPKPGGNTTAPSQVVQKIVQQYTTAQFENSLGRQSTPAEEAAYFLRNSSSVTSVYQLLGDRVMLDVIEGALGLPKNIAVQPIESQARLIKSQLDIKQLQRPQASSFAAATADQTTLDGINQVTSAAQSALKNVVGQIQSIMQQYSLRGRTAAIDAQLRSLVNAMPSIETGAGVNGQNLISTSAKSIGVTLKTTGNTFTIRGHADFDSLVNGVLRKAVAALASPGVVPTALLQQAYGAATSIQGALNLDVAKLVPDQSKVSALVAQQAKQDAVNQINPYAGASSTAKSLVQRYLALHDVRTTAPSQGSSLLMLFPGRKI